MIILKSEDFEQGFYRIPQDEEVLKPLLCAYITKYEKKWIYWILGQALGDLLIADLNNGVPQSAIYLAIFNPFTINDANARMQERVSEGLKNILMAKVFYEFTNNTQYKNTLVGLINAATDTATKMSYGNTRIVAEDKYNESVEWIQAIQWYCLIYSPKQSPPGNYPTFAGQITEIVSSDFL